MQCQERLGLHNRRVESRPAGISAVRPLTAVAATVTNTAAGEGEAGCTLHSDGTYDVSYDTLS